MQLLSLLLILELLQAYFRIAKRKFVSFPQKQSNYFLHLNPDLQFVEIPFKALLMKIEKMKAGFSSLS